MLLVFYFQLFFLLLFFRNPHLFYFQNCLNFYIIFKISNFFYYFTSQIVNYFFLRMKQR
eukprot:UN19802